MADRVTFKRHDASQGLPASHDAVLSCFALHEMADTQGGFRSLRKTLLPGGSALVC